MLNVFGFCIFVLILIGLVKLFNVLADLKNVALRKLVREKDQRIATLERMDREAAQVESIICMRTHFTGTGPYVGWKGVALALEEALDERDHLRNRVRELEGKTE